MKFMLSMRVSWVFVTLPSFQNLPLEMQGNLSSPVTEIRATIGGNRM